jgi:hypothetical protein
MLALIKSVIDMWVEIFLQSNIMHDKNTAQFKDVLIAVDCTVTAPSELYL